MAPTTHRLWPSELRLVNIDERAFEVAVVSVAVAVLALVALFFTCRKLFRLKRRSQGLINVEYERDQVAAERDALSAQVERERRTLTAQIERWRVAWEKLKHRYQGLIDVEHERERVAAERDALTAEIERRTAAWEADYAGAIRELEELSGKLDTARDRAEVESFGIYEPHYNFETSAGFKAKLDEIRTRQKRIVRNRTAAIYREDYRLNNGDVAGQRVTERYLKLQLRAFNGECDAAVITVRFDNIGAVEKRIIRAFEAVNKLGEALTCTIEPGYLDLKISELYLAHEFAEKREAEKDEQRQIRQQMREEERVRHEIEKTQADAEKEERRYEAALKRARQELRRATELERAGLEEQIAKLEEDLDEAHAIKDRAVSQAQQTKSGHVYVISNIGSFGKNVYKIGLTRRLEPDQRIRELGDASVPFPFDVHAMIFSEDAPELEQTLHRAFDGNRVNLVNRRKEFFAVSLSESEAVAQEFGTIEFTLTAEAEQYRKTVALRGAGSTSAEHTPETQIAAEAKTRLEQRVAAWS